MFQEVKLDDFTILLDLKRQRISSEKWNELFTYCEKINLSQSISNLLSGHFENKSEQRKVFHTGLRNPEAIKDIKINGERVSPFILEQQAKQKKFVQDLYQGNIKGATGKSINHVVNIGIGGSDLGPWMVSTALRQYQSSIKTDFVSNIDDSHLDYILEKIDPERCMFIIASKTFTTVETITNAQSCIKFLSDKLEISRKEFIHYHMIGVSAAPQKVAEFGIQEIYTFEFKDWVGGRFSIWSAIGLIIACKIGWDQYMKLHEGAKLMDHHFGNSPLQQNLPVLLALSSYHNVKDKNIHGEGVIPYSQYMNTFPAFCQQLLMESNGKDKDKDGHPINYRTSPIVWGKAGTNCQHSFFQAIHQGQDRISLEMIAWAKQPYKYAFDHRNQLFSNFLAQIEALDQGRDLDNTVAQMKAKDMNEEDIHRLAPYKVFKGQKDISVLMFSKLNAKTLGALIALYEHKTMVLGELWNINSFDQWGVELGKEIASSILDDIKEDKVSDVLSKETQILQKWYYEHR